MDYAAVVRFYKTAAAAAEALDVTPGAVAQWKIRGRIPEGTQAVIQIRSRGRLRADNANKGDSNGKSKARRR